MSINHFHQILSLLKAFEDLESCSLRIMDSIIFMMQIAELQTKRVVIECVTMILSGSLY